MSAVEVLLVLLSAGQGQVHAASARARTECGRPRRRYPVREWGGPAEVTCAMCVRRLARTTDVPGGAR